MTSPAEVVTRLAGPLHHRWQVKLRDAFVAAGLTVELVSDNNGEVPSPSVSEFDNEETQVPHTGDPVSRKRGFINRIIVVTGIILFLLVGAGLFGWYWLNQPLPSNALAVEKALADGNLVAIAHANINRIALLTNEWTGLDDSNAIPVFEQNKTLLKRLFTGSTNFRKNLEYTFLEIHTVDEKTVVGSVILTGNFCETALINTLKSDFDTESQGNGRWPLMRKHEKKGETTCPKPENDSLKVVESRQSSDHCYICNRRPHSMQWVRISTIRLVEARV